MKHYLPFILAALILVGCITQNRRARICATCATNTTVKDSVGKQTITYAPIDTNEVIARHQGAPITVQDCPELLKKLKANKDTITTIQDGIKEQITDGPKGIKFACETDSLNARIQYLQKQVNTPHYITLTKTIAAHCDREHTTWFDKICRYWFFISLGAVLLVVAIKLIKLRL